MHQKTPPKKNKEVYIDSVHGNDSNPGTQDKPVKTFPTAFSRADLVCVSSEYPSVTFGKEASGKTVSGACPRVPKQGGPPTFIGPVVVKEAQGFTLEGCSLRSETPKKPGGSSISLKVINAGLFTLRDVQMKAGPGENGEFGSSAESASGNPIESGKSSTEGGAGHNLLCGDVDVSGGAGGLKKTAAEPGKPAGRGGDGGAPWDNSSNESTCQGEDGKRGENGADGLAGTLHINSQGELIGNGEPGKPGQHGGGGGGGGASGFVPGGGGGAGGCGGHGGQGGQAGGSSVGILATGSTIEFDRVTIHTDTPGKGGAGGTGSVGQSGGPGGNGADPNNKKVCGGGAGGPGGNGGNGGQGADGISASVLYGPNVTLRGLPPSFTAVQLPGDHP